MGSSFSGPESLQFLLVGLFESSFLSWQAGWSGRIETSSWGNCSWHSDGNMQGCHRKLGQKSWKVLGRQWDALWAYAILKLIIVKWVNKTRSIYCISSAFTRLSLHFLFTVFFSSCPHRPPDLYCFKTRFSSLTLILFNFIFTTFF